MIVFLKKASRFVLLSPAQAFEREKETKPASAFTYLLAMLLMYSLLGGALSWFFKGMASGFVSFFTFFLLGLVATIVAGFWLHLWAYGFGARGVESTLKVVFFGSTPVLAFGWLSQLPGLDLLRAALLAWSIILYGIGLKKMHGLTTTRAGIALVIAVVLGLSLLAAFAIFVLTRFLPLVFLLAQ